LKKNNKVNANDQHFFFFNISLFGNTNEVGRTQAQELKKRKAFHGGIP